MPENNDCKMLAKRFCELAARAADKCIYTETDFLGLAETDILLKGKYPVKYTLYGGFDGAERCIAVFGDENIFGYSYQPDIVCISICPISEKYAEKLTHRDFLGALMNLGIERKAMGDIIIKDNKAYLMALGSISEVITEGLSTVRRTSVKCELTEAPSSLLSETISKEINVKSERADAVIAAVYNLSREASKKAFDSLLVYINGRLTEKTDCKLKEGDKVTLRHSGRFTYEGIIREGRKGNLHCLIKIGK